MRYQRKSSILGADAHVVGIQRIKTDLAVHADGIDDTVAGKARADRHANWGRQIPRDVTALWTFVAQLDHDSRMALFAHCVALTVNAVRLPWERRPRAQATANKLAKAVSLDMTGSWRPTVRIISAASPRRVFLTPCGTPSAMKRPAGWRT